MTERQRGISTRLMLVAALVLVIGGVTIASLLIIRDRMQQQVLDDFSADLAHSVENFQNFEAQRLAALQRENDLLADLPNLKALMTTSDERTIADGGVSFWKIGDNDLFALASSDGKVIALYTRGDPADAQLRADLDAVLTQADKHYLLSGGRLFEYSVRPLYFGSEESGTLLGYVISGFAVDAAFLRQVKRSSSAEIAFLAKNKVVAGTTLPALRDQINHHPNEFAGPHLRTPTTVRLGAERYLIVSDDLSQGSSVPLQLAVMKSFDHAERSQHEINRLLIFIGLFALLAGTALMLTISGMVTRPLELLARSVRAFGTGNSESSLPRRGTREVLELSVAFGAMRDEIRKTNHALLESERLATIGRMASSVSHDLRHYLAAVYANAEFLASSTLSDEERADLFADIRMAVQGTTELIESLLIFSRTSGAVQRVPELVANLLERAMALVKAHPDAGHVAMKAVYEDATSTIAVVDSKQMERALYNLLLNACQAGRRGSGERSVTAAITTSKNVLTVRITDDGGGVSDVIRESLFEPFVSEGKQNGTGLGLTMAQCVAKEHGGSVQLISSRPGETVFVLSIARGEIHSEFPESKNPAEVAR